MDSLSSDSHAIPSEIQNPSNGDYYSTRRIVKSNCRTEEVSLGNSFASARKPRSFSKIASAIAYKLSRRKSEETFKLLHTILFDRRGKEKQKMEVKEKLDKCVKEKLLDICDVLDIPIAKTTTKKDDIVTKLLDFLVEPHATTTVLLVAKERSSKGKKRGREGSASRYWRTSSKCPVKVNTTSFPFIVQVIEYIQFLQEKVSKYEGYPGCSSEPTKLSPLVNILVDKLDIEKMNSINLRASTSAALLHLPCSFTEEAANMIVKRRSLKLRDQELRISHAKADTTPAKRKTPLVDGSENFSGKKLHLEPKTPNSGYRPRVNASASYEGVRATKSGKEKKPYRKVTQTTVFRSGPKGKDETKPRENKRPSIAARKAKANALRAGGSGSVQAAGKKLKFGSRTPQSSFKKNKKAKKSK